MRIEREDAGISWIDVADLFARVGWDARDPEDVRRAFARSSLKVFAFENDELIGFGRTIDDGQFYATVVDVVVSPAHQRKGVGRAIVEDLQSRLQSFLVVTLIAAPDVQPFYEKLGWHKASTGMLHPRPTAERS